METFSASLEELVHGILRYFVYIKGNLKLVVN